MPTGSENVRSSGRSQPVDATLYLKEEMECMVMVQRFHRGFTAAEKTELWDRWKRGESLKAIGRAFGKPSSSIYFLVAPHGGIRPALRRRSRRALTLSEREVISPGCVKTSTSRERAELFSLFAFFDGSRQRCSFLIQLIRGKRSTRVFSHGLDPKRTYGGALD
jgi:hypothetical protein